MWTQRDEIRKTDLQCVRVCRCWRVRTEKHWRGCVDTRMDLHYRWERFQVADGVSVELRHKRAVIMRDIRRYLGVVVLVCVLSSPGNAQYYYPEGYYDPYSYGYPQVPQNAAQPHNPGGRNQTDQLQYDSRDAEMILRDQVYRNTQPQPQAQPDPRAQQPQQPYDNYYGNRISDETQLQQVMAEARHIGSLIRNKNGKPFVVIDKRNFQFYLYNRDGGLLRIGPVAVGKGKTNVGAFETPVGVFPIRSKVPIDDWIRPDWYFVEEGEPIPKRYEDRRVPGFFRYKLVFDGSRHIHYAEATGGRMTHGCIGLDWLDAEAVFHTMQVGSNCIVIDDGLLTRLARGEFPAPKPAPKKSDEAPPATPRIEAERKTAPANLGSVVNEERIFRSMW
jgi:lipoprotein-anchoring transpeptidase ErfK/SrfK